MAKKSLYDKTDGKIQRWSKTISAVLVIIGAIAGVCSWVSNQFANAVSDQISGFQEEMERANTKHEQTITRVELIALIEHDDMNYPKAKVLFALTGRNPLKIFLIIIGSMSRKYF